MDGGSGREGGGGRKDQGSSIPWRVQADSIMHDIVLDNDSATGCVRPYLIKQHTLSFVMS